MISADPVRRNPTHGTERWRELEALFPQGPPELVAELPLEPMPTTLFVPLYLPTWASGSM